MQSGSTSDADTGSSSNPLYTTTYNLNALGQLTGAGISDGRPRTVAFTNDELGQIIRRDELGSIAGQLGNPHQVYYRYAGRTMGETGNNGSSDMSLSLSIAERQAAAPASADSGTFRGGRDTGVSASDLTQSYDAINSYGQGSAGGSYTVRSGDSLGSIALTLYGDANLWYKLAEANGLSAASALSEGVSLRLPAGIQRSQFNASTLSPYDPSEAVGDLSPTTPKPPKNNKCAVVGQLLLAVVAIGVAALLGPALIGHAIGATLAGGATAATATGLTAAIGATGAAIAGGALAAAGGSIVSQGLGVATGLQDKFSFKGVALAALAGGIGGGINAQFGGGNWLAAVGRGAASSAISQGIGVATGLQSKFSFAGVAAAGVAAGVGAKIGGGSNFGGRLGVGAARLLASAATRSAIEGSNFGDNIRFGLPDVLAQTIVDAVAGAVTGGGGGLSAAARAEYEANHAALRTSPIDLGSAPNLSGVGSAALAALAAYSPVFSVEGDGDIVVTASQRRPMTASQIRAARTRAAARDQAAGAFDRVPYGLGTLPGTAHLGPAEIDPDGNNAGHILMISNTPGVTWGELSTRVTDIFGQCNGDLACGIRGLSNASDYQMRGLQPLLADIDANAGTVETNLALRAANATMAWRWAAYGARAQLQVDRLQREGMIMLGGMFGPLAGAAAAASAPAWLPSVTSFAGYSGSASTMLQALGLKAGIGLSIELGANSATGSETTFGGLSGTVLASALIAPSATRIYGFGAKGLTIAGGASGFGGNLTGQFIDYFSTGRALNRTDLLLSTGFGLLGGRLATPLLDRFAPTSLLFQRWSPAVDELFFAPATAASATVDVTRKIITNQMNGH